MRTSLYLPAVVIACALGACAAQDSRFPSLQPRAGELIDPRLPVERPINDRPVTAGLAARLDVLVAQARAGDREFTTAAAAAERLVRTAGPAQSESWTVAQEAVSAAIGARRAVSGALGDIDAIAATALQNQGGLAPNDLAAIRAASSEVASIDEREGRAVDQLQASLAR